MPQPKGRRRPAAGVGAHSSSCLCGDSEESAWATSAPIKIVANLGQLREFYASLKPAAQASVLKSLPLADLLPQVTDATQLGLDEAQLLAARHLTDPQLIEGCGSFFLKILNDEADLLPGLPPGIRMSDQLVSLVCTRLGGGLFERFGGCVPPTHTVIPCKQGLVRFPSSSDNISDATASIREAAEQGVCRPLFGVHYRAWTDPAEVDLYRGMLDCCRLMSGLVVVLQRRLHRAMMRAHLVKALAASGPMAHSLARADTCQTWSWGLGGQGQLGLGATRQADIPTPIPALANQRAVQVAAAGNHAFALCADGILLSWGAGQHGVTGLHDLEPSRVPMPCSAVAVTPEGMYKPVMQVATGELHTLALQEGRAYGWGCAWLGQLGNTEAMMDGGCMVPYHNEEYKLLTNLTPGLTFSPEYLQVIDPAAAEAARSAEGAGQPGQGRGSRHSACLAMLSGQPVCSGPEIAPDKRSMRPGKPFNDLVAVAAGATHSVGATSDGECWVWGCHEAGTLGAEVGDRDLQQPWVQAMGCGCCDGKDMIIISVSAPLQLDLNGVAEGRVVSVAAGSAISVLLTDRGEVVTWGASRRGPWRVDPLFAEGEAGGAVAAGGPYAMAVTEKTGSVWFWERNHMLEWNVGPEQQLLSRAKVHQAWTPKKIPFLSHVEHIACSATHGIAASRDHRVFWWPHTALSPGQPTPTQSYEVVTLRGLSVLSVAVGNNFAVCSTGSPKAEDEDEDDEDNDEGGAQEPQDQGSGEPQAEAQIQPQ